MTPHEIVDAALEHLTANYVWPDRATKMADAVRDRLARGEYDSLAGAQLCAAVTADLRAVYNDQHVSLAWHDEPQPMRHDSDEDTEAVAGWRRKFQLNAEGVHRVERLPGNVGLIGLSGVGEPQAAGAAYTAAMLLVAHTYALIVDVRRNGGGWPEGAATFCSYFVGPKAVHLSDMYDGSTRTTRQFWSTDHLPAPRYLDRPVYVLTSARTFSGGEDVAYTLQALGRATVVGEATAGAAQPFTIYQIDPHVDMRVPVTRPVNPVTGTNWEGTGVIPDVAASAGEALDVAHARALRDVLDATADSTDRYEQEVRAEAEQQLASAEQS